MPSKPQFVGEKVRLGDCFPYIKNGYNVRQGKDKGGIPITRIETLSDNQFNRDKVGYADIFSTEGLENRILEDGDILMSHINSLPYLGRSVMYRARPCEVIIHGMNLLRLKADRSIVEPEYAELYFRSPHFKQQVLTIAKKAVNQASFSVNNLKELEFPLMSLCDQRDAIEKLSSISAQIEYCQRVIGKLDQLVKSRFVEMFGDEVDAEIMALKDVCSIITDGTHQPPKFSIEGIPFLFVSNIVQNSIVYETNKYISEEDYECLIKRTPIEIGDILVSAVGSFGHPAVVKEEKPFCFQRHIAYLKPMHELIDSNYLHAALLSDDAQRYMNLCAKGVAQRTVTLKSFKEMRIPVPPLTLQQEFANFASQVDKSRFVYRETKGTNSFSILDVVAYVC